MLSDKVEKQKRAAEHTLPEGHGDTSLGSVLSPCRVHPQGDVSLGSALSPFQTRAHERKF